MGVSKDEQEAIKWYTLAADQGNELAKKSSEYLILNKPYALIPTDRPNRPPGIVTAS